jgi:hypothetical protein
MGDTPHDQENDKNDSGSVQGPKNLTYNSHLEHLISSEAEKALVLFWLHDQSEKRFSKFSTWITIPVIVLSTLAGTASIGSQTLFGDGAAAPIGIGAISIAVGIMNTVSSYFGWAKRAEGHRISSVNYSKLHRWISIELALPRDQRVPAKHFLKEIRSQIDRFNETSPPIPPEVIQLFSVKMKDIKDTVSLPEVCNNITAVHVYPEEEEAKLNVIETEPRRPEIVFKDGDRIVPAPLTIWRPSSPTNSVTGSVKRKV